MIEVRRLVVDDLDALTALEVAAQDLPWTSAALLVELVHEDAFVCGAVSAHDALVGHVVVRRMLDECWILNIATHPAARRQGVGRRLLEAAVARGRAWLSTSLWLEVRESNAPARALYAQLGLGVVGRRPGYYPPVIDGAPREAAVLMSMAL